MGFVYDLPFAKELEASSRRSSRTGRSTASSRPTPGRRSRSPAQPGAQLPGLLHDRHADQRPGRPEPDRKRRLEHRALVRPVGVLAADRHRHRRLRHQPAQPVPHAVRLEHGLRDLPLRSRSGRLRPELRIQVTNLFNHTNWGRPVTDLHRPALHDVQPERGAPVQHDLGHRHGRASGPDRPAARVLVRSAAFPPARPRSRASGRGRAGAPRGAPARSLFRCR